MITDCPNCKGEIELPETSIGGKVRCPYCEKKFYAEICLHDVEGTTPPNEPKYANKEILVATTGREYEECLYKILRDAGLKCELTPESCDQGVDLIVSGDDTKIAIQCKLYTSPVGNDAVQEVVAGAIYYGCNVSCVVTNASYTQSAEELASANHVALLHHSDLLDFIVHVMNEESPHESPSEDYEDTQGFKELLARAEKGAEDARAKLGDYYFAQLCRFASVDLSVAAKYFTLACHVGEMHSLDAYHDFKHAMDSQDTARAFDEKYGGNNPYGLIFQELSYSSHEFKLPQDFVREIEYDWFITNMIACRAEDMPLGHRRNDILNSLKFAKKYWEQKYYLPRVTYYLAMCKLRGWGTVIETEIGVALLNHAANEGHIQAKIVYNSLPNDELGEITRIGDEKLARAQAEAEMVERELREKKVADDALAAKVKALHRPSKIIKCPKCGVSVSTDSQFCWSCNEPVPGWTGCRPEL